MVIFIYIFHPSPIPCPSIHFVFHWTIFPNERKTISWEYFMVLFSYSLLLLLLISYARINLLCSFNFDQFGEEEQRYLFWLTGQSWRCNQFLFFHFQLLLVRLCKWIIIVFFFRFHRFFQSFLCHQRNINELIMMNDGFIWSMMINDTWYD